MAWKNRTKVERTCVCCGAVFRTPTRGKSTAKFCSRKCAAKTTNSQPETKRKISEALTKPTAKKNCDLCGKVFAVHPPSHAGRRRFCGSSCAAKWRLANQTPEQRERRRQKGQWLNETYVKGKKAPHHAERMRRLNQDPEFRRRAEDGVRRWHKQNPSFLRRGGKPEITKPQAMLHQALAYPKEWLEHKVLTRTVRVGLAESDPELLSSLPNFYLIDIVHLPSKTAIEVDGNTHYSRKWKWIDRRKQTVLEALGWTVLRFWNKEVLSDTSGVVAQIAAHIDAKASTH